MLVFCELNVALHIQIMHDSLFSSRATRRVCDINEHPKHHDTFHCDWSNIEEVHQCSSLKYYCNLVVLDILLSSIQHCSLQTRIEISTDQALRRHLQCSSMILTLDLTCKCPKSIPWLLFPVPCAEFLFSSPFTSSLSSLRESDCLLHYAHYLQCIQNYHNYVLTLPAQETESTHRKRDFRDHFFWYQV